MSLSAWFMEVWPLEILLSDLQWGPGRFGGCFQSVIQMCSWQTVRLGVCNPQYLAPSWPLWKALLDCSMGTQWSATEMDQGLMKSFKCPWELPAWPSHGGCTEMHRCSPWVCVVRKTPRAQERKPQPSSAPLLSQVCACVCRIWGNLSVSWRKPKNFGLKPHVRIWSRILENL